MTVVNIGTVEIIGDEVNLGEYPYQTLSSGSILVNGAEVQTYGAFSIDSPSFSNYADMRLEIDVSSAFYWVYWERITYLNGDRVTRPFGQVGSLENDGIFTLTSTGQPPAPPAPLLETNTHEDGYYYQVFNIFRGSSYAYPVYGGAYAPTVTYFGKPISNIKTATLNQNHPCYRDLVSGYPLDNRKIPNNPCITPAASKKIIIKYYKENRLEQIPDLKTICWMVYECDLVKGEKYYFPIEDCTLGTLYCSDNDVLDSITSLSTGLGEYRWSDLLPQSIPSIFTHWQSLYNVTNTNPANAYVFTQTTTLRKIAANNDVWNNAILGNDINSDLTHPMFKIDRDRAYGWHLLKIQDEPGSLFMDSPRTIEIHASLNSSVYSKNPTTGDSRVANLGHLVEKIAAICGYRPEPDGTLSHDKEKTKIRTVISKDKPVDPSKVGVTSFGEDGMVLRRLNNKRSGTQVTANECVLVIDLPQILAEYQDQLNLALGLQESSAISVETQNGTAKYDNQLAVLVELLNLTITNHDLIRSALVSSLVAQGQTTELIAGMGLPSVTKTLPVEIDGKMSDLPYKGIAAHRSLSQEIAVCTQNVGIVAGQLI